MEKLFLKIMNDAEIEHLNHPELGNYIFWKCPKINYIFLSYSKKYKMLRVGYRLLWNELYKKYPKMEWERKMNFIIEMAKKHYKLEIEQYGEFT